MKRSTLFCPTLYICQFADTCEWWLLALLSAAGQDCLVSSNWTRRRCALHWSPERGNKTDVIHPTAVWHCCSTGQLQPEVKYSSFFLVSKPSCSFAFDYTNLYRYLLLCITIYAYYIFEIWVSIIIVVLNMVDIIVNVLALCSFPYITVTNLICFHNFLHESSWYSSLLKKT